jgi:RimJ/RimL family protein N-acetyltransferase
MKRAIEPFGDTRIRLRLLRDSDLDMTRRWRNHDAIRVWFKTAAIIESEQHRAWYDRYALRDDDFVFVVEAEGRPVGMASVYGIDWAAGIAEVGRFIVAPEEQGRGYMGIACAHLVRFCAGTLRLKSVFLEVKEDNSRAIAVYVRNGFLEEERSGGMIRMRRLLVEEGAGPADA